MKILIIEDEPELQKEILNFLQKESYLCESASTFAEADEKLTIYEYDVAVVDISLPDGNGLSLIEKLKKTYSNTGIIIISARNSLDDRLRGLDLGADDYLTKPFHLVELNSRIKAIQRRRHFYGQTRIIHNEIEVFPESATVTIHENEVMLTRKEFELLMFFIGNKNRILTKESIAEHLWGDDIDLADNYDFIYTHINNLRKKIDKAGGSDYLKTMYGLGYKYISE